MKSIQKLLVVVDPTVKRDFVVERAMMLAKITNAKIKLFINNNALSRHNFNYEGISTEFFETQRKLFEEQHEKLLTNLVTEFTQAGIEASADLSSGNSLAEAIIERVNESKPDLVLKSTHHHSLIERTLITNTDWILIRKCPVPLMLVKPNEWKISGSIVTAIDPMHIRSEQSTLDELLLTLTGQMAHWLDLKPHLFHSYFPFASSLFPMGGESEEYLSRIRLQHQEKLKLVTSKHAFEEENVHLCQGELIPALIQYLAKSGANLLVMGSLSRSSIERAIIGNTA
ncbi:MAG: universal stress protein E [Pseudohongiellaceae bacterium]|jgi:universal stress protein E